MILPLHTGPKSAPRLALFDTTGISIVPEAALAYYVAKPNRAEIVYPNGRRFDVFRPEPSDPVFQSGGAFANHYEDTLAAWEAGLAVHVAKWEAAKAKWEDDNFRAAAVWHGPRTTVDHEGNTIDLATFVHETVEEIADMLRCMGHA